MVPINFPPMSSGPAVSGATGRATAFQLNLGNVGVVGLFIAFAILFVILLRK
jgi:hypothetical protein